MKHALFRLLFCTCCATLVVLAAVAVRSFRVGDFAGVTRNYTDAGSLETVDFGISTGNGRFLLSWSRARYSPGGPRNRAHFARSYPPGTHFKWTVGYPEDILDVGWDRTFWGRRGLVLARYTSPGPGGTRLHAAAPFWLLAIPPALPLAVRAVRVARRARRRRAGACPACGYDLRGSPDRCPECGRPADESDRPPRRRAAVALIAVAAALAAAAAVIAFPPAPPRLALTAPTPGLAPPDDPRDLHTTSTGPTTPPTTSASIAAAPPEWRDLPTDPSGRPIPKRVRDMAASIDPARTYVFHQPTAPRDVARYKTTCVQVFARRAGRWRMNFLYVKVGDPAGNRDFPTDLKVAAIEPTETDVLLTLEDPAGNRDVRSGAADRQDPVRRFLTTMTGHSGSFWDKPLFGP